MESFIQRMDRLIGGHLGVTDDPQGITRGEAMWVDAINGSVRRASLQEVLLVQAYSDLLQSYNEMRSDGQ